MFRHYTKYCHHDTYQLCPSWLDNSRDTDAFCLIDNEGAVLQLLHNIHSIIMRMYSTRVNDRLLEKYHCYI